MTVPRASGTSFLFHRPRPQMVSAQSMVSSIDGRVYEDPLWYSRTSAANQLRSRECYWSDVEGTSKDKNEPG